MTIRIKFAKYGTMKFIGHLDTMRFFQKAIRRADIDIKYSEGFSPHQIMSFAAPLGVGIESAGEYLDIEVNSYTSTELMKQALGRVMVDGMDILSVKVLPDTVKNAMASVAAAGYQISGSKNCLDQISGTETADLFALENLAQKLEAFCAQEQIPVTKQTKKSTIELDLKPAIYELSLKETPSPFMGREDAALKTTAIYMLVNASSSGNIKPSMVLNALCDFCKIPFTLQAYRITRLETYTSAEDAFIPLEDVGQDAAM